jgi:hypothetical protein
MRSISKVANIDISNNLNELETFKRNPSAKSSSFMQKSDIQLKEDAVKTSSRFIDYTPSSHSHTLPLQHQTNKQMKTSNSSSSIANNSNHSTREPLGMLAHQESFDDENELTSLASSSHNFNNRTNSKRNHSNNNKNNLGSNNGASMIKSGKNTIQIIQDGDDIRINIDGNIEILTSRNSDRRMISLSPQVQRKHTEPRSNSRHKNTNQKKTKNVNNQAQQQPSFDVSNQNTSYDQPNTPISVKAEENKSKHCKYHNQQIIAVEDVDEYFEKEISFIGKIFI